MIRCGSSGRAAAGGGARRALPGGRRALDRRRSPSGSVARRRRSKRTSTTRLMLTKDLWIVRALTPASTVRAPAYRPPWGGEVAPGAQQGGTSTAMLGGAAARPIPPGARAYARTLHARVRVAAPVSLARTTTTPRRVDHRRERRKHRRPRRPPLSLRRRRSSIWASRPGPSRDRISARSLPSSQAGNERPRQEVASSGVTFPPREREEKRSPTDFFCARTAVQHLR